VFLFLVFQQKVEESKETKRHNWQVIACKNNGGQGQGYSIWLEFISLLVCMMTNVTINKKKKKRR
jgi:hypothetical protein